MWSKDMQCQATQAKIDFLVQYPYPWYLNDGRNSAKNNGTSKEHLHRAFYRGVLMAQITLSVLSEMNLSCLADAWFRDNHFYFFLSEKPIIICLCNSLRWGFIFALFALEKLHAASKFFLRLDALPWLASGPVPLHLSGLPSWHSLLPPSTIT